MLYRSVLLATLLPAAAAPAQDWATKETCTVDLPEVHEETLDPPGFAALETGAADIANGVGRFWKVTAPNGAISHLWGTMRSSHPLILDLPRPVQEAISGARTVAIEVDETTESREEHRTAIYFDGYYNDASDPFMSNGTDDGTIAGLPLQVSDWIRDRAFDTGWSEDAELVLSPAGLAAVLSSDPCEDFARRAFPTQGSYIQLLGILAGSDMLALEKPGDFLADLKGRDETAEAIIAVRTARLQPVDGNQQRSTLFALYLEGRIGLIRTWQRARVQNVLGQHGRDALRIAEDYMLAFRNKRFLDKLAEEFLHGEVFVAVDADQIPGETGLIRMFRDAGLNVQRILLAGEAK